jgi:hypothetical protein
MNTNPFIKPITSLVATGALTAGLLFAGAPAANADNTVTQPALSQAATSAGARFWAKAATVVDVQATAHAVAIAGIDVTGKVLLEEVRTVDSNKAVRDLKVPTKRQVAKAPVVHTMEEANALSIKMVGEYKKAVTKWKLRVKELKQAVKHAPSAEARAKYKVQLRKAKKRLRKVVKNVPRMKGAHGMRFKNTGYRDRLDLQAIDDRVDGRYDVFQYVPQVDDWVIIVKIRLDGTWVEACHNYVGFIIPPGTPLASAFIIVRNALEVEATVTVSYTEYISLTVGGEMYCLGRTQPVTSEKTVQTQKSGSITRTVSAKEVNKYIAFGDELVRLHREAQVGTSVSVSDQLVQSIGAELTLECPNNAPVLEIVQFGKHLFPNGVMRYKVVAGDLEDGANIALNLGNITVTGQADLLVDADHPVFIDVEGGQKVMYFWVKAKSTPGNYTVTARVTDSKGDETVQSITKPVVPDEF